MRYFKQLILVGLSFTLYSPAFAKAKKTRAIFLNGVDISSAKHQSLENVTVRIDGQGDLYIEAPHYEVNEESTYIPLSSWNQEGVGLPNHMQRGKMPKKHTQIGASSALPKVANQVNPVDSQRETPEMKAKGNVDGTKREIPTGTGANPPAVPGNQAGATPASGGQ